MVPLFGAFHVFLCSPNFECSPFSFLFLLFACSLFKIFFPRFIFSKALSQPLHKLMQVLLSILKYAPSNSTQSKGPNTTKFLSQQRSTSFTFAFTNICLLERTNYLWLIFHMLHYLHLYEHHHHITKSYNILFLASYELSY